MTYLLSFGHFWFFSETNVEIVDLKSKVTFLNIAFNVNSHENILKYQWRAWATFWKFYRIAFRRKIFLNFPLRIYFSKSLQSPLLLNFRNVAYLLMRPSPSYLNKTTNINQVIIFSHSIFNNNVSFVSLSLSLPPNHFYRIRIFVKYSLGQKILVLWMSWRHFPLSKMENFVFSIPYVPSPLQFLTVVLVFPQVFGGFGFDSSDEGKFCKNTFCTFIKTHLYQSINQSLRWFLCLKGTAKEIKLKIGDDDSQ